MTEPPRRFWAVVPAAGSGARMRTDIPKQYLPLAGRSVLDRTLGALLAGGVFERLVVVLAAGDGHWCDSPLADDARVITTTGAASRCESVSNGLARLSEFADGDDWVAVHDAARPCVTAQDLQNVLSAAQVHADGALLAIRVTDTLKSADAQDRVSATLDRERLWRALTPQVFPLQTLRTALETAMSGGLQPTDEAQAMELAGYRPRLVQGRADNLKITRPDDLQLAEAVLRSAGND
ncbi:MAG: 2-C-methyl-D-erythritol 4-phosphate cytidylyltransferase [Gammaproteobacteria bacterium]|nr:2-C-methyl-D-erythritol 4-phosphate cytidylyltransferase [Gammaproteobacteria bacterium]